MTGKQMNKQEFEQAAAGLRTIAPDLSADVIAVETVDAAYFRDGRRQRCIVEKNGQRYVSFYD